MTKLKTALVLASVIFTAGIAHAADSNWKDGANTVRGLLGFNRGEVDVGVDYERRMGTMGLGGFVLFSAENQSTAASVKPEQLVVGIDTPIHLIDNSPFDVYLAPGVAYVHDKEMDASTGVTTGSQDEATWGPLLRFGMLYTVSSQWAVGLDFIKTVNWSNDDVTGEYNFANIGVAFSM